MNRKTLTWIALAVLPALSSFYALMAVTWSLPFAQEIPITINGVDAFLCAAFGIKEISKKEDQ